MRLIQIIPTRGCRLYGLMVRKEVELSRSTRKGTFYRSGPKMKNTAKWSHTTYKGWIWLERGLSEIVSAELRSRSADKDEWQLLHAFLGFLDRYFADKIEAINIQYVRGK